MDRVLIFDTTLRDGEQSPGASLTSDQKLEIAQQLARLNVDIVEAGFPAASPDDFEAVRRIAQTVKGPVIAGLARTVPEDVDRCWEAVRGAEEPRIHVFLSTSDIHLERQFNMTREQGKERAVEMVKRAKSYCPNVEFSPMDATRSDWNYLYDVLEGVIQAGATTINIADTVGYALPDEFGELIAGIFGRVPSADKAVVSVHCHNDLGLSTANSLAAVKAGARQVEVCVNGLGERAGNAALEEVVMAMTIRGDLMREVNHNINLSELHRTSRMVSDYTGLVVQRNKAVVGQNAFAHESGIHQDGMLKDRDTYEIMRAEAVGYGQTKLVLGKHSGRHALRVRLADLGYELSREQVNECFVHFKNMADYKKEVTDEDLRELMDEKPVSPP